MSDEIMRINRRFLDLYDEIIAEINAVSLNLENLSDELITDEDYYSTSLRLEHIHNLFDKVSDVLKELPLTQDNPDLYSLLEKKKLLNRLFGELSGLEHTLSREHNRAKGKDDELVPERELNPPLPEVIEEEPLEEPDLELFPEDDIEPEHPDFSYNTIYAFTPDGILTQDYSQVNIGHSIPQYNSYIPFMPDGTPFHKFDDIKVESTKWQYQN